MRPASGPLCGAEGWTVSYTDDPDQVQGCDDCLELVAEDLQDENGYRCRAEPPLSTDQRETGVGSALFRLEAGVLPDD